MVTTSDPMAQFLPATQQWFRAAFGSPTPVQVEAWQAIGRGSHGLVIAPTGSGKTLAAFLHSVDRLLASDPVPSGVQVLYVSPMKALGVDVERNLRLPLAGIAATALERGETVPAIRVGVRSGDTAPHERRRLVSHPPQILITTPESLFLMLSSAARQSLTTVSTVIIDEIHYLAGTKRGAHLAVSLERLDALNEGGGCQRVGLSATVRPIDVVARFLTGSGREAVVVAPTMPKKWQLDVVAPVEDMTVLTTPAPGSAPKLASSAPSTVSQSSTAAPVSTVSADVGGSPTLIDQGRSAVVRSGDEATSDPSVGVDPRLSLDQSTPANSIWPHVEREVFDLVMAHRSTICFANSRGVAERLTNHLNALYRESVPGDSDTVIARTHHGSVSKSLRLQIESDLKQGLLPCVVATNSLELGIDMGAVDLVIQVGSPPSVASGLQRIGRGGHQVSAISHGVLLPLSRSDLLTTTVVTARMVSGLIEPIRRIVNPLDVLAQQLVSMCLDDQLTGEELRHIVTRADCFADLPVAAFDSVVDMLTGAYPSEDFAEFRPRLTRDQVTGRLSARPGARRLVTTSGGTIPDRGLFTVVMAGDEQAKGSRVGGRRVGELDEEMVYESRIGDIFTLGASAWRIDEIDANQVVVSSAPGQTGRMPFWHGDEMSRSAEVGAAIGSYVASLEPELDELATPGDPRLDRSSSSPDHHGQAQVVESVAVGGQVLRVDPSAQANLVAYLRDQRAATSVLPDATTIVVEAHRDEMGAWRVCVHSPLGRAVLQPWAMIIQRNLRLASGLDRAQDPQVLVTDDGIVLRLGEVDSVAIGHHLWLDPGVVESVVATELQQSALLTAHFRQCAARALLLPRRDPGKRSPLWQQRLRASQLLGVAASYPDFPIVAEALRECLSDVFDLEPLKQLMRDIAARRVRVVEVTTERPSPFATALLFGYTGAFMYDYDAPIAERAAAANWVDPELLASLLLSSGGPGLDTPWFAEVEAELQRTGAKRRARSMEAGWDLLREMGPLTPDEWSERTEDSNRRWLDDLRASGRVVEVVLAGRAMVAVTDDAGLLADLEDDSHLERIVRRWMGRHTVVTAQTVARRFGVPAAAVSAVLDRLVVQGWAKTGRFVDPDTQGVDAAQGVGSHRIDTAQGLADQHIATEVLERVRRHGLTALRAAIQPVSPARYASFLTRWQEVSEPGSGVEALLAAVDQLAGYPMPVSMV
ncbi:MAG: DEAD/DEAH box helicase [Propionibacteriaceae bacterium]|jgi:ATP-dependent Lhr-like helicase|nr:DEAD/DEAH box helicase [Propionibacteriaceae bacterium]